MNKHNESENHAEPKDVSLIENQNQTKTVTMSRKDFNNLIESSTPFGGNPFQVSKRFIKDSYNKYQTATLTAISTSVLLLVTLSWNDVMQSIIKKYYPKSEDTLSGKVKYALIISFVVLTLQIFVFPYLISREEKKEENK
jgi:hypothetical protein